MQCIVAGPQGVIPQHELSSAVVLYSKGQTKLLPDTAITSVGLPCIEMTPPSCLFIKICMTAWLAKKQHSGDITIHGKPTVLMAMSGAATGVHF